MSVTVSLTMSELRIAAEVGVQRHMNNLRDNRHNAHGLNRADDNWSKDIDGAGAEMAVAKHYGIYWCSGRRGDDDVGPLQVRNTVHRDGHLAMYEKDKPERAYILAIGLDGVFKLVGWLPGHEGKVETFWKKTPRGTMAFWIPQSALRPIVELDAWLEKFLPSWCAERKAAA